MTAPPWTSWTVTPHRLVVELDEALTPAGLALELDVELDDDGVQRATWRLEDGTPIARVRVGLG